MPDTRIQPSRKDIQAAIHTVLDGAGNALHAATYDELQRFADNLDQAVARDEADRVLGGAVKFALRTEHHVNQLDAADLTELGRTTRGAVEATGARIVTADEQPEGELIGYRAVKRTVDLKRWCVAIPSRFISPEAVEVNLRDGERVAALYLLPEAVSDGE